MPTYHVLSQGIAANQDPQQTLSRLATLFNTDEERVAPLLASRKVLKKLNSLPTAERYCAAFVQAGLDCSVQTLADAGETSAIAGLAALDPSWETLVECPQCGFHQPRIHQCQNCGAQLHELEELGRLDTRWTDSLACASCGFTQPPGTDCRNCGKPL